MILEFLPIKTAIKPIGSGKLSSTFSTNSAMLSGSQHLSMARGLQPSFSRQEYLRKYDDRKI